jgi:hypothetical protein
MPRRTSVALAAALSLAVCAPAFGELEHTATDPVEYKVLLDTLGRADMTPDTLSELEHTLWATGTDERKARAAILIVIRNPESPGGWASEIVMTARDISAVMGMGLAFETRRLVEAMRRGYEPMAQLGFDLNALSAADAARMDELSRHGRQRQMERIWLDGIEHRFHGTYKKLRDIKDPAWCKDECVDIEAGDRR